MVKKSSQWSYEEEWILFLLNRDLTNKWSDIANLLEGRTDNTIKNHWNSCMKKRIKECTEKFQTLFNELCNRKNITNIGCEPIELDDNGHP